MAASIVINQSGKPAGTASLSRDDLGLSVLVSLTNSGSGTTFLWELLSRPPGSSATLSTPTASSSSFTPDIVGSYLIKLTVDGSFTDTRVAAVRLTEEAGRVLDIRIPANLETTQFNANPLSGVDGWHEALYEIFTSIDDRFVTVDTNLTNHTSNTSNPHTSTLDKVYDGSGSGAGRSITVDSGAVRLVASGGTALDLDGYVTLRETTDPTALNNSGLLYTKDDGGDTELYYRDDSGNIIQLTRDGTIFGNTLDNAYDEGGAGAGRTITVDTGAVRLDASGGTALDIDGYATLRETSDPTFLPNSGMVYAKDVSGTTELFYIDSSGNATQLTGGGTILGNTLDKSYDEGGAGAGRSITVDSGPVLLDASGDMALDVDGYVALQEITDPSALVNTGMVYTKDVSGTTELFYIDSDGNTTQLTSGGTILGNTLDNAYDEGGAGSGRTITVDSGPVLLDASGDMALDVDGYVALQEITDPSALVNTGMVYTKDVSGTTELFYIDSDGNTVQLTSGGTILGNTLDNAYDEGGSGVGRTITIDNGAVVFDASGGMAVDIDGYIALRETIDPTALPNTGVLYTKDDSGDTELYYMDDSGNVVQLTKDGGFIGASLDGAYDAGGLGGGRVITVDSGAVVLDADGYEALDIDGYITFRETIDPTPLVDSGHLYSSEADGYSELFYMDNYGDIKQLTEHTNVVLFSGTTNFSHPDVASALAAATSGDLVQLGVGNFYVPPNTRIPAGVTLRGHCPTRTTIRSNTGTGPILLVSDSSSLRDISIYLPTDATAAIKYDGTVGAVCSNIEMYGVGSDGYGLHGDGTGRLAVSEVNLFSGSASIAYLVTGRVIMRTSFICINAGDINHGIHIEDGGDLTVEGFSTEPGTVHHAIHVEDGYASGTGIEIRRADVALHVTDVSAEVRFMGFFVRDTSDEVLLIDEGLGSGPRVSLRGTFNRTKVNYDAAYSDVLLDYIDDRSDDQTVVIDANLEGGRPEDGHNFEFGKGGKYSRGMIVLTTDDTADSTNDGGNFIDVSSEAASVTVGTFTFQGVTDGHTILIASTLENTDDLLKFYGLTFRVNTAAVEVTPKSFVFERWDGSAWTSVGIMATSVDEGYRYSNVIFIRAASEEFIRFGLSENSDWAKKTINGIEAYWMRIRIVTTITTAPTFDYFKISSDSLHINLNGNMDYHGHARYRETLVASGNVFGTSSVGNFNVSVGSGGTPTGWTHTIPDSNLNSNGDELYFQFPLPRGICTSCPLKVVFSYIVSANASPATTVTLRCSLLPVARVGNFVADPAGGKVPIARPEAGVQTLTSNAATAVEVTAPSNATGIIYTALFEDYSIQDYYEGDIIFMRLTLFDDGTQNSNIGILSISVSGVIWSPGTPLLLEI